MNFNVFDDQIKMRNENDRRMLEGAFADLGSILEMGVNPEEPGAVEDKSMAIRGAIAEILEFLGEKVPPVPEDIADINAQLEYMLRPSGIMRRRIELVGAWWRNTAGCMLGSTTDGEVIAIMPSRFSGYTYKDRNGRTVKVNRETARSISTDAFCFYRPFPAKKLDLRDIIVFMFQSISKADLYFAAGVSLLVSLLGMFLPFMNKQIFDMIIPSGTKSDILSVAALLAGAAAGSALFGVSRGVILSRFHFKINLAVQSAMMMRIFSLPASFFKDWSAGDLAGRVMSVNTLCNLFSKTILTVGLSALFSFVYVFQMASYAPPLVGPGLLILFVMIAYAAVTAAMQLKIARKRVKLSAKLSGLIYTLFSGVQKIKLAGAEKRAFAQWAAMYKEEGRLTYVPPLFLRLNAPISLLIAMGGYLVLFYFAAGSKISPADYMAFNAAYGSVSGAIMALAGMATTVANIAPILETVQPVLESVPETGVNKKILTILSGNIEVNNLTFRYDKDGPAILDNISLKIRSGEYVAIVGKTGCGKSTLMRLLLGFEKPETGGVYFDGYDLDGLDLRSLRQCIGVDLQNGKLFAGDIFSNIIITSPWKTLEDAWEAAEMAGIADDIKAMPMGMHTVISEGGGGISGGQRQRLLIARALVSKPRILFFDEATSALDNITQKHVSDCIGGLKCTRLVIAHRLSTIRDADRIIVVDGGRIAEEGRYDTLMAKQGDFYELVKRQTI